MTNATDTERYTDTLQWTRCDPNKTAVPAIYLPRYAQGEELDAATTTEQADEIHERYLALADAGLSDAVERETAKSQLWADYAGRIEQLMGC